MKHNYTYLLMKALEEKSLASKLINSKPIIDNKLPTKFIMKIPKKKNVSE